ncbi:hypothetical protein BJV82DRAFT_596088 [Fennellomyces sp. T-0311]|nr:hypothetical protein BJV82DRAFT_596088 [Fennellomyces sp. T-0311]
MDKVFQTNPSAILGSTWGQAAGRSNSSTTSSVRRRPSSVSAASFDNGIDDYTPLTMSAWGSQNQSASEEMPKHNWDSLVDPNFTVKEGGLGSGQLHRSGSNFKPVSETAILNQRLSKPVATIKASTVTGDGAVKKKKKKKKRTKIISMPVHTLPLSTVNGWGSGQLTSTPFWEQQQQSAADSVYVVEDMPLLKIEVELAPGVSIPLTILKGDRMDSLVEDLCNHHHLTVTQEAKVSLAATLTLLIQAKYP